MQKQSAIPRADVKNWLVQTVAPGIEEFRSAEITAEHAQEQYKGILAWLAHSYIEDDLESLIFADGSSDGGIDIASVSSIGNVHEVVIYQLSVPSLDALGEGQLQLLREKYADDVRHLRKALTGDIKKLKEFNPTARSVIRKVNQALELLDEAADAHLTIEVQPLSLYEAHPDAHHDIEVLAQEANAKWSSPKEVWGVRPIKDVFRLYAEYQQKRPKDQSPEELKLKIFGDICGDHAQRGPFLSFLSAIDLVQAYDKWGAGLLDANLRFSLGNTEVNKVIKTALSRPSSIKWFHERNNGVVITCNACHSNAKAGFVRLIGPQIVNGGQTLHSIRAAYQGLQDIHPDQRTDEEKRLLQEISTNLKISARIVVLSGGGSQRSSDEIAVASNTQNKLSERTMRSSLVEMRDLRLRHAALSSPWFVTTKDGEWSALSKNKPMFQSKTGNRQPADFKGSDGFRRVENTDLGVALLAFWGLFGDAKPSRVFTARYFDRLFGMQVKDGRWKQLAKAPVEWGGPKFQDIFESGLSSAPMWLIGYFVWDFWHEFTYPESRQFILAYEEEGVRNPEFRAKYFKDQWKVPEVERQKILNKSDSCYWPEQVAKSAYLVLTYQTMRILVQAYGDLSAATCDKILRGPQFSNLYKGSSLAKIGNFREGSLADGPLTAVGRILYYACTLLWLAYEEQIRTMASRQQVLLQEDWVNRLSEKVDSVCAKIGQVAYRQASSLDGPNDVGKHYGSLTDIFGIL